ncbi:MAG: MaoC family dehydratase [Anaerolineae bacterium]
MSLEAALADLKSKVGTETHVGDWLTITQDRINQFAAATGDFQWIHTDVDRANAESPFGATIAHGYLTLSLIPYLTESVNPDKPRYPGLKMGVNYGLNRVRFPHPVAVGARIRTRTELQSVEEVKGGGLQLVNKITVEIDGAAKPACVAETVTRLYF